jgi:hypothetical protein
MANYEWEDQSEGIESAPEASFDAGQDEDEAIDPQFVEAEERIRTAQYYRLLLEDSFFSDRSPTARKVEKEIRTFVRQRMEVLLGMRVEATAAESPFSPEQVEALKFVANRVIEKPSVADAPKAAAPRKEGKLMSSLQVAPAPAPAPAPQRQVPAAPPTPALKKTAVPESLRDKRTAPAAAAPGKKPPAKKNDGSVKIVNKEGQVSEEPVETLPPNPKNGAPRIRRNGKILERAVNPDDPDSIPVNAHGGEIWLDITPQTRSSSAMPIPMPPASQMEAIGMQQAVEAIGRVGQGQLADVVQLALSK